MKGQYEHTPAPCRFCGSAPRLHTGFGFFWYECGNYQCARKRPMPDACADANIAFESWNDEDKEED